MELGCIVIRFKQNTVQKSILPGVHSVSEITPIMKLDWILPIAIHFSEPEAFLESITVPLNHALCKAWFSPFY